MSELRYTLSTLERMLRSQGVSVSRNKETEIFSFSFSSKMLDPGALFIALRGKKDDGHRYVDEALQRGAVAVMVARGRAPLHAACIEVDDPYTALKALAVARRLECSDTRRIALTGSTGKTTTKELIYSILSCTGNGYRSPGNYNTLVGISISCLQLHPSQAFAVCEFGMDRRGEIAELADIFFPDIGLITNIGHAHIGNIGRLAAIAEEKRDIFSSMSEECVAVIPGDSKFFSSLEKDLVSRVETHGRDHTPGLRGIEADGLRGARLVFDEGVVQLPLLGAHNVENALAAIRVAQVYGVPFSAIRKGVESLEPVPGRLTIREGRYTILDDTYNASPESMRAALETLAGIRGHFARSFVILGGMEELGSYTDSSHEQLVDLLQELGFDGGLLFGACYERISTEHLSGIELAKSFADILLFARRNLQKNDVVLIKGSRFYELESIVHVLLGEGAGNVA